MPVRCLHSRSKLAGFLDVTEDGASSSRHRAAAQCLSVSVSLLARTVLRGDEPEIRRLKAIPKLCQVPCDFDSLQHIRRPTGSALLKLLAALVSPGDLGVARAWSAMLRKQREELEEVVQEIEELTGDWLRTTRELLYQLRRRVPHVRLIAVSTADAPLTEALGLLMAFGLERWLGADLWCFPFEDDQLPDPQNTMVVASRHSLKLRQMSNNSVCIDSLYDVKGLIASLPGK